MPKALTPNEKFCKWRAAWGRKCQAALRAGKPIPGERWAKAQLKIAARIMAELKARGRG